MVALACRQGLKLSVSVVSHTEVLTANHRVRQPRILTVLSLDSDRVNLVPTAPVPSNVCGMAQSKSSVDYENGPYDQPIYSGTWPWVVSLQTAVGGFHFVSSSPVFSLPVYTVRVLSFSVAALWSITITSSLQLVVSISMARTQPRLKW